MSKFNKQAVGTGGVQRHLETRTANGGVGYLMEDKAKLMTQVMTCFFGEKKFYGGTAHNDAIVKGVRAMLNHDPKFVANLGVYAREVLHLRSVAHVIAAELANHPNGKQYAREAISSIVERPDDMTEIFAYFLAAFAPAQQKPSPYKARPPKGVGRGLAKHVNKKVPNSMKKGLADAFKRFDEFSLQKYNGSARQEKGVKLRDIYLVSHPSPNNQEQWQLWQRLLADELATPVTWETQLSERGNTREVWEELIAERKVGYMAALRNLRNMVQSGARNIDEIYDYLMNPVAVARSKQLPFRFLSAFKMAQGEGWGTSRTIQALETALKISAQNIKKLPGKTFFAADASGSMHMYPISAKSIIKPSDIAVLLMAIGNYISDEAITSVFATSFKPWPVSMDSGILANASSFNHADVGAGTNGHLPVEYLLKNKIKVDRIVMFSDNMVNPCLKNAMTTLQQYRREVNPDVWVHAVDLMGTGVQQYVGPRVNLITGWSEKVLDFIRLAEIGAATMIQEIENHHFK